MATVAISGGTSGLGLTIVEALILHGGYSIVIFSRKVDVELKKRLPVRLVVVDYDNVDSLTNTLESNDIGTVICTINANGSSLSERNLVSAAERSSKTCRFIPSIFAGFEYPIKYPDSSSIARSKFEVLKALEKTSLIYTAIYNGMFMDYYGSPLLKSNVRPFPMFIDILNKRAAIPGSGTEPIVFTHVLDIARFVVRMLELPAWPQKSYIIGDRVTLQEFIQIAEKARGTKFHLTYDSKEDLEKGRTSDLPCYSDIFTAIGEEQGRRLYSQVGLWAVNREMDLDLSPGSMLNTNFPDIRPMTVKEFLEFSWKV
ncbi:hypothetical protein F1880_009706 [Penicillium rolfsii]|nr:hypothetical protein F1880_009706 [Penicillium rolfsii]